VRLLLSLPAGDDAVEASDAAGRRAETFRALKTLTLRAAERQPVVMLVEDLHWIDAASEEYLAFLADVVPTARVLLVLTHRQGHRHPFGDRSYHRRIMLAPLDDEAMAAMAGAVLAASSLPDELRTLITRKAEGNPLFVEEVTKSLLEDGVLARDGDRIVLARQLADVVVPDSIHGVLMARLDRLDEGPKHALQLASVIGREFALRLLERVTDAGEGVSALVGELRALELIYEKAAHPELAYMFKHALTHDVAYESILLQRRRELHRTIGVAIEELYADRLAEHYETLALHFGRAEDWQRAFDYHARAAEKALAAFASEAVVFHCREALAIGERLGAAAAPERRQALEEMLGAASFYTSRFVDSGEAYARAAGLATDVEAQATNLARAGESLVWGHRYDTAAQTLEQSVALARRHGLRGVEALALAQQAFHGVVTTGDVPRFAPLLEGAITAATEAGNEEALAAANTYLFETLEWRGRYREAIPVCEAVIASGRRLHMAPLVVWGEWFLAKASCCLGDYARALAMLRESNDLCERIGDRAWRSRLFNTTGWALSRSRGDVLSREQRVATASRSSSATPRSSRTRGSTTRSTTSWPARPTGGARRSSRSRRARAIRGCAGAGASTSTMRSAVWRSRAATRSARSPVPIASSAPRVRSTRASSRCGRRPCARGPCSRSSGSTTPSTPSRARSRPPPRSRIAPASGARCAFGPRPHDGAAMPTSSPMPSAG
jgi:tetratricopeptide (TPR) repeat protein